MKEITAINHVGLRVTKPAGGLTNRRADHCIAAAIGYMVKFAAFARAFRHGVWLLATESFFRLFQARE